MVRRYQGCKKCKNCQYWQDISIELGHKSETQPGCCNRFPPIQKDNLTNKWLGPTTDPESWCGEFKIVPQLLEVKVKEPTERKSIHEQKSQVEDKDQLLRADEVAKLLNVSRRHVFRLKSAGKLPKPLFIGASLRWPRRIIADWIKAGTPDRKKWDIIKNQL
jgi:excisionase family DNA binding protein